MMKPLYGEAVPSDIIKKEKKQGVRYSEVTLGEQYLIHSYFFKTRYIAYRDIVRIFMRVAGGEFGEFPMDEYSLVVIDAGKQEHVLHVERGEYVQGVQKLIQERFPHIHIGKER